MNKKNIEEEIDFKSLLKNPIRLFGFSYIYFFLILLGLGIFFVKNIENISYNKIPVSYIDSLNIDRDIELKKGGSMPAMDILMISKPTDKLITKGKELFAANCVSCHGEQGNGDGAASAALNPKPRNFHQKDSWTNGRKFSDMYKTLQEGIIKNGMSAYEYLPPLDRVALISYIRTFETFPEITETEIAALDASYGLSNNVILPNQIPIKLAIEKLNNENSTSSITLSEDVKQILQKNSFDLLKSSSGLINAAQENSLDVFITAVSNFPADFSLKSTVKNFSKDEWQKLYNYFRRDKS